jgi:hypothetical protein
LFLLDTAGLGQKRECFEDFQQVSHVAGNVPGSLVLAKPCKAMNL